MDRTAIIERVASKVSISDLPAADWDLISFIQNSENYLTIAGGALMGLLGLIPLIWGVILVVKNFLSRQGQGESWFKILAMIIVGGLFIYGGFALILSLAEGGNTTIEDLGGGFILPQGLFELVR